jgi:adenosylcobinamide kinase/adenosylcobinamide-phosphate guanylyltransferase
LTDQLILILGGARSGKSTHAEKVAAEIGPNVLYIATAEAGDDEMAERIIAHRADRPATWQTLEAPRNVGQALANIADYPDVLLLDCLTLLVTNILLSMEDKSQNEIETAIQAEIDTLLATRSQLGVPLIVVSNEVGLGLVPEYPLGRMFRDGLGRANQHLATRADHVILMVAGIPMTVKEHQDITHRKESL